MRLPPFTPAASWCAMSDLGVQPGSRSRSWGGVGRTSLALVVPGTSAGSRGLGSALLPGGAVPEHGPHHPHQVVGRRHQGDLLPLRILPPGPLVEGPDGRGPADRLPGGLGHHLATDRRTLPGDVPEPVPLARLVLAGDEPEVPADRLRILEAV